MGILDDVTFAEEPLYPLGSKGSIQVTDEEIETLKEWLASALDEEKVVTVDGAVTKTDYSHNRIAAREIFKSWRRDIVSTFDLNESTGDVRPFIIDYYTLSYSNSEDFEYNHNAGLDPYDDFTKMYHLVVVLEGSFKTDKLETPLDEKGSYFVYSKKEEELVSNHGEKDSLILCINLGAN